MPETACCTCAELLPSTVPSYNEQSEKPAPGNRALECCGRLICGRCIEQNERLKQYCPYCQIATGSSSLPRHGLREPPAYSAPSEPERPVDPPAYTPSLETTHLPEKAEATREDVLHYVNHMYDSISSLSLAYGVAQDALRRKNNLFADHLLAGRKIIWIPGELYDGGVSLSPSPIEGELEEIRKSKIRKWMVRTKNADYDAATLYLQQAQFDLECAVANYEADDRWEREHPMAKSPKGRQQPGRWRLGGGFTSRLS